MDILAPRLAAGPRLLLLWLDRVIPQSIGSDLVLAPAVLLPVESETVIVTQQVSPRRIYCPICLRPCLGPLPPGKLFPGVADPGLNFTGQQDYGLAKLTKQSISCTSCDSVIIF